MNSLLRKTLFSITSLATVVLGVQSAQAAITTTGCAGTTLCTLQELLNGGTIAVQDPFTAAAFTINSFTVTVFGGGPTLPSFDAITVTPQELVAGTQFGLTFDFDTGFTTTSTNARFGINYNISSVNASGITGAVLENFSFGGVGGNPNDTVSVTKTVDRGSAAAVANVTAPTGPSTDSVSFSPTPSISVADILRLDSQSGNPLSILGYTQAFSYQSTPEPGTLLGLGLLGVGALVTRKRKANTDSK